MTMERGIELLVHIMGGFLICTACERDSLKEENAFMLERGSTDYDDLVYGMWLLSQGWTFSSKEHPDDRGFSFFFEGFREDNTSNSWTWELLCPKCSSGVKSSGPEMQGAKTN